MSRVSLKKKKSGQSLVEYGLILALVSVVSITMLQSAGDVIKTGVETVSTRIQQANSSAQQT